MAAVEFAMLAPLLAAVCLGLIDTANYIVSGAAMQRAVRSGIQYEMAGGTDTNTISSIVLQGWTNHPSNAGVATSSVCTCASGTVSCTTQTCSAGGAPQKNSTITTTATFTGIILTMAQSVSETVRVQ